MLADAAADFTIIGDVAKHVCFVVVVVVVVLLLILLLVVVVVVVVVVLLPCALQLYASMWLSTSDHNFQRSMSRSNNDEGRSEVLQALCIAGIRESVRT